jgi:hypothetical protein
VPSHAAQKGDVHAVPNVMTSLRYMAHEGDYDAVGYRYGVDDQARALLKLMTRLRDL